MPTIRGRRAIARGSSGTASVPAMGARGALGTASPTGTNGLPASMRVPRAQGLVGVGVGPNQPATYPVGGPGLVHPLIDFRSVITWRILFALAAAAYITGFHITLPGGARLGLPRVR